MAENLIVDNQLEPPHRLSNYLTANNPLSNNEKNHRRDVSIENVTLQAGDDSLDIMIYFILLRWFIGILNHFREIIY